MTGETLSQYVWDEQKALTESMKKSGRKDFWYSDIETAIVRAVDKEREVILNEIKKEAEESGDLDYVLWYIQKRLTPKS